MTHAFHVDWAFCTPVIVAELDDAPDINPALEAAILERRIDDPTGLARTNRGGWHSDVRLAEWGGDAFSRLQAHALAIADANTIDAAAPTQAAHEWKVQAWANVIGTGAAHEAHAHGGSYWSAIYYVRVDEGDGGELVLHDPRMPLLEMHAPSLRFRDGGGERRVATRPRPGMLILIPAWLVHSVTPYLGDGLRISVSMNVARGKGRR